MVSQTKKLKDVQTEWPLATLEQSSIVTWALKTVNTQAIVL